MKCSKKAQTRRGPRCDSGSEKEQEAAGKGSRKRGVALTWGWDEVEEAGTAGPAAIRCHLPVRSPGACSQKAALRSYFTPPTPQMVSWALRALGCTQGVWWNPFCLSTHWFLSLRAWLWWTSAYLPGTVRGLLIPSRAPSFPASPFLMPNHLVAWACRQRAKVSLLDMFSKGQLSLKSTQIFFYITHMLKPGIKMHRFSTLLKKNTHKWCLGGSTKVRCIIKYLPTLYQVTSKVLTTQDSEAQPLLCSVEGTLFVHPPGQLLIHCRAIAPECCGPQAYFLMSVLSAIPSSQISLQESNSCL